MLAFFILSGRLMAEALRMRAEMIDSYPQLARDDI